MKKKIILPILILVLSLGIATTALYAWFAGTQSYISNIEFNTGKIDMTVSLFAIRDFNRDGIPDYNPAAAEGENNLFLEDILNPPEGTVAGIVVKDALPGQIFSYRFTAKNLSSNAVSFALSMTAPKTNASQTSLNDCFSFRTAYYAENFDTVSMAGEQVKLVDAVEEGATWIPAVEIPAGQTLVFDFQLVFERLSDLKARDAARFGGLSDLNAYLGKSFENCKFLFEFRQSAETETE